ncbi:hypothetical protein N7520_009914 [Penicillium odoratum]|uniref:uncharacterized protein n=1 Tax=Penicillium odoratum TaxID=1167516 RepID=UPI002547F367|nr:uncharacterized protein N7520_009914 [Penicillium odoratum]KAJ5752997.1 hypothetical protein N7520_009914 [Penicillium odoratum]
MTLPVLIIGAGLGGITNLRTQGYRLKITEHGTNALKEALTPDLFTLFEQTCATTSGFGVRVTPDGIPIPFGENGPPKPPAMLSGKSYTVDRSKFRVALLTELSEHVFFGKKFVCYEISDSGVTVTAFFADGSVVKESLLVGADGVHARVRKQYLPTFPGIDTGMRIVFGKTPITSELLDSMPQEYQTGMSLASAPGDKAEPTLMWEAIRFPGFVETLELPDPYMYWVLVLRRECLQLEASHWRFGSGEAADLAKRLTGSWVPGVRSVVDFQDRSQSSIRSLLFAEPEIQAWEPSAQVTLLGDAVHVMPPTGAMGANTALRDAADLARRIVAVGVEKVDGQVIGEYEAGMRVFARLRIDLSWQGGIKSFGLRPVEECEKIVL